MSAEYDATEFVDSDFQASQKPLSASAAVPSTPAQPGRAPMREEVDLKVGETRQKLDELKRMQESLERERAALEETRRRQNEFKTGREEMLRELTRGVGLVEEAEFSHRRDAEEMSKSLAGMREALGKVEVLNEESWAREHYATELTRALTVIENARMEWNSARLKYPILSAKNAEGGGEAQDAENLKRSPLAGLTFGELCRMGFALTLPLAAVLILLILLVLALRR